MKQEDFLICLTLLSTVNWLIIWIMCENVRSDVRWYYDEFDIQLRKECKKWRKKKDLKN